MFVFVSPFQSGHIHLMYPDYKEVWSCVRKENREESSWRLIANLSCKPAVYTEAQIVPVLDTSLKEYKRTHRDSLLL